MYSVAVVNYVVQTVTGAESKRDLKSGVFVNMFGKLGDIGDRKLIKTKGKKKPFGKKQVRIPRAFHSYDLVRMYIHIYKL